MRLLNLKFHLWVRAFLNAENVMRLKLQLCSAGDVDQLHKCYIIATLCIFFLSHWSQSHRNLYRNTLTLNCLLFFFCRTLPNMHFCLLYDIFVVQWIYHHLILFHLITSVTESRKKDLKLFHNMTQNIRKNTNVPNLVHWDVANFAEASAA